jgi:hypothetical protein
VAHLHHDIIHIAESDISRNYLQAATEEEQDDDITGFNSGDMGLQARALYDYQAGKLHIDVRPSFCDMQLQARAVYDCQTAKFSNDTHSPSCGVGLQAHVLYDCEASKLNADVHSSFCVT